MANILYRASATPTIPVSTTVKNTPLTNLEVDANFKSINDELVLKSTKGVNSDITSLVGLTTPLSTSQGGTGKNALNALSLTGQTTAPNILINRSVTPASGISWYNNTYTAWVDYMGTPGSGGQGPTGTLTPLAGSLVAAVSRRSFVENTAGFGWVFESGLLGDTSPTIMVEISSVTGAAKFLGNVAAPTFTSTVATGTSPFTVTSSTPVPNLNIGGNAATVTNGIYNTGNQTINGILSATGFNSTSDARAKTNIRELGYGLSDVLRLTGKKFEMMSDGSTSIGLVAQEVAVVIPEVVSITNETTGMLGVNYPVLVAVLIESIKELHERILVLENR